MSLNDGTSILTLVRRLDAFRVRSASLFIHVTGIFLLLENDLGRLKLTGLCYDPSNSYFAV